MTDSTLLAVADILAEERRAFTAEIARLRERLDDRDKLISLTVRGMVKDELAALNLKDGKDGEPGPPGKDGQDAYPGKACGLHDPAAEYRALDLVAFNGCEWRATRDNPGPLPSVDGGWVISAKQGRKGDKGERGPPGPAHKV